MCDCMSVWHTCVYDVYAHVCALCKQVCGVCGISMRVCTCMCESVCMCDV